MQTRNPQRLFVAQPLMTRFFVKNAERLHRVPCSEVISSGNVMRQRSLRLFPRKLGELQKISAVCRSDV